MYAYISFVFLKTTTWYGPNFFSSFLVPYCNSELSCTHLAIFFSFYFCLALLVFSIHGITSCDSAIPTFSELMVTITWGFIHFARFMEAGEPLNLRFPPPPDRSPRVLSEFVLLGFNGAAYPACCRLTRCVQALGTESR